jgi:hypothetical protein
MRCYKVEDKRIVLELDGPIYPGDRLELIIRVEDTTSLPPMEQEPEIAYTGVEQEPDWMRVHVAERQARVADMAIRGPRKLTKEELRGERIHVKGIGPEYEVKRIGGGRWRSNQTKKRLLKKDATGSFK